MTYLKRATQPDPRSTDLPESEIGPGLHPGETVFTLDTLYDVAVCVVPSREAHTGGLCVKGRVRYIEPDGRTILDSEGAPVQNEFAPSFSPDTVKKAGTDYLCKQVLLLMMGEDLDADLVIGTVTEPNPFQPSEETVLNVSIKQDIKVHHQTTGTVDAGALLT